MNISNGWLDAAECIPSPNADLRPEGSTVNLLVIHNISLPPGQFGGGHVAAFFTNQLASHIDPFFDTIDNLRVSAHLFIDREGEITQFVSLNERAWHAGVSCYEGRPRCNDFSIGIELEGTDIDAYTDAQYTRLETVSRPLWPRIRRLRWSV